MSVDTFITVGRHWAGRQLVDGTSGRCLFVAFRFSLTSSTVGHTFRGWSIGRESLSKHLSYTSPQGVFQWQQHTMLYRVTGKPHPGPSFFLTTGCTRSSLATIKTIPNLESVGTKHRMGRVSPTAAGFPFGMSCRPFLTFTFFRRYWMNWQGGPRIKSPKGRCHLSKLRSLGDDGYENGLLQEFRQESPDLRFGDVAGAGRGAGRVDGTSGRCRDAAEQPMVAVSDAATIASEATGNGGIVAVLLQVHRDEASILDRQALPDGIDAADGFSLVRVFRQHYRNAKGTLATVITRRALRRVHAVHLLRTESVERRTCHKPHSPPRQTIDERGEPRRSRVESRQRFHQADKGVVYQLFRFGFGASVAFQLEPDGLADLASDGKQDAFALVPNGCGIGRDRLLSTAGRIRLHSEVLRGRADGLSARRGRGESRILKLDRFGGGLLRGRDLAALDEGKDRFDMLAMPAVGVALASAAVEAALQIDVHVVLGRRALNLVDGEFLETEAESEVGGNGIDVVAESFGFVTRADGHEHGIAAVDGRADGDAAFRLDALARLRCSGHCFHSLEVKATGRDVTSVAAPTSFPANRSPVCFSPFLFCCLFSPPPIPQWLTGLSGWLLRGSPSEGACAELSKSSVPIGQRHCNRFGVLSQGGYSIFSSNLVGNCRQSIATALTY